MTVRAQHHDRTAGRRSSGVTKDPGGRARACGTRPEVTGSYTASYTRNYSSEWLVGGPARPAITTDLVNLPARLPAPHVDEKKGGSGSRAVSLRVLGSGRAGRQRESEQGQGDGGAVRGSGRRKGQKEIQKDKSQKKDEEGQKGAVRDGRRGGRWGGVKRLMVGVGEGR